MALGRKIQVEPFSDDSTKSSPLDCPLDTTYRRKRVAMSLVCSVNHVDDHFTHFSGSA